MRIYDPRVGRFLSVDPLTRKYPELTPYQFASNTPVKDIDLDGLEGIGGPPLGQVYAANKDLYDDLLAGRNTQRVQNARTAGAVIVLAGALALDVFVTKGWATRALLAAEVFGAFPHNPAHTPQGRAMQEQNSKEALADAFLTYGTGYLLGAVSKPLRELVVARIGIADNFYKEAGFLEAKQRADHINGIDFTKSVETTTFKKGTELVQWTYLDEHGNPKVGNYFTLPGQNPANLGIPLEGRVMTTVKLTEDTKFLKSTTASIEDWTKKGSGIILKGGGVQLFQTNVKYEITSVTK